MRNSQILANSARSPKAIYRSCRLKGPDSCQLDSRHLMEKPRLFDAEECDLDGGIPAYLKQGPQRLSGRRDDTLLK